MTRIKQKNSANFCSIVSIILLTLPIFIFGVKDNEVYQVGSLSNQIFNKNYYNPFIFFLDLLGPGINFPIGNYPFYHPISIFFASNLRYYFLISGIFNLFIQIFYFNKILKFFDISKKDSFFSFLILFSIANFNNYWSDDWMSVFYTYTFYFPIIYYILKLLTKTSFDNFIKFSLVSSFSFINSHPGVFYNIVLFTIIFILLNGFKKILKNKYFYVSILLILIISSHNLYYLFTEAIKFQEIPRAVQNSYSIKYYFASLGLPFNLSWMPITRYPYIGLFFVIALICSYDIFKKNNSKKFYFINYIFFFFTIWSLTKYVNYIPVVSGIWQARDIVNITSFILFFIYLKQIKKVYIKKLILFINILMILIFYLACFYKFIPYNTKEPNILVNNNISKDFKIFFYDANKNEIFENKIYFGPNAINEINSKQIFKNEGIFNTTDFIKLNLSPFQSDFKNISLDQIQKSEMKMRGWLKPKYEEINSEIFLSIFRIKYLLLSEIDYQNLKNRNNFFVLSKNEIKDKKFYFLKRKNFQKHILILRDRFKSIQCEKMDLVYCIEKYKENFYFTDKIFLFKINEKKFTYNGNIDKNYILVTNFLFDQNWNSSNGTLNHLDKRLILLDFEDSITINFDNKTRFYLLFLSFFFICVAILYLILKHIFLKFKYKIK